MAERFSDIEPSVVRNTPSVEERLKEYPELKAKIETMLAIIENAGGDVWRRQRKPRGGSSRKCGTWGMKSCTGGPAVSSRKRKRNTTPSRG